MIDVTKMNNSTPKLTPADTSPLSSYNLGTAASETFNYASIIRM